MSLPPTNSSEEPEQLDLKLDPDVSASTPPRRARRGRWTGAARPAPDLSIKRVVDSSLGALESPADLERLPATAAAGPSVAEKEEPPFGKFRPNALPTLQPNKVMDLLADVAEEPLKKAANSRRRTTFRRTLAMVLVLGAGTLATLHFLGSGGGHTVAPRGASPTLPTPTPAPTVAEAQSLSTAANGVLRRFLDAVNLDARRNLSLADDPIPSALSDSPTWAALRRAEILTDQAEAVPFGSRWLVLVPVKLATGDVRLAALRKEGGDFRLDWRSVATAETMAWSEFLTQAPTTPTLFRVNLVTTRSDDNLLMLTVRRPGSVPETVEAVLPRAARAAADSAAALARPEGLWADVWMRFDAPGAGQSILRVLEIVPEKWRP